MPDEDGGGDEEESVEEEEESTGESVDASICDVEAPEERSDGFYSAQISQPHEDEGRDGNAVATEAVMAALNSLRAKFDDLPSKLDLQPWPP